MMKKAWVLLALVVLAACLMGFAFGQITPAAPLVQAASAADTVLSSARSAAAPAVPVALLAQPAAFIVTGLVCGLFGLLAVAPLLLSQPER